MERFKLRFRTRHFKMITCVFVGVLCIAALLFILPIKNMIGGIFALSCIVMTTIFVGIRIFKKISKHFFKKDKKDV